MSDCLVTFSNGKRKLFTGSTSSIVKQVYNWCKLHDVITEKAKWNLIHIGDDIVKETVKETNGKHNGETIYCPVNGTDCPYYENGICYIANPIEECDDFAAFFESWEDWEEVE